jgi:addiction module RelE/StbE family toxin
MVRKAGNMKIFYHDEFIKTLKKANVRIRKSYKNRLIIFRKNPYDPLLKNHSLRNEWYGYRSINITANWRAIYKDLSQNDEEFVIYFVAIGTHKHLYCN